MTRSPGLKEKVPDLDYEGVKLETVLAVVKVLASLRSNGHIQVVAELEARRVEVFKILNLVARAAGFSIQFKESIGVAPVLANKEVLMAAINKAYRPRTERTGAPVANKLALLKELVANMFVSRKVITIEDARAKLFGDREFKHEDEKAEAYTQMSQWIKSLNDIFSRNKLPIMILCTPLGISMRNRDAL